MGRLLGIPTAAACSAAARASAWPPAYPDRARLAVVSNTSATATPFRVMSANSRAVMFFRLPGLDR